MRSLQRWCSTHGASERAASSLGNGDPALAASSRADDVIELDMGANAPSEEGGAVAAGQSRLRRDQIRA